MLSRVGQGGFYGFGLHGLHFISGQRLSSLSLNIQSPSKEINSNLSIFAADGTYTGFSQRQKQNYSKITICF
jgi:hypothetical protein